MEHQEVLLNEESDFKFVSRKWNIVNDNSSANYGVWSEIVCNIKVLKYDIFDYNNAYILVRGNVTIIGHPASQVAFKNCAPFTKYITKIDGTTIDDAEDLDLVMSMYNLIEYSSNYSETTRNLWFYSKDEANDFNADIAKTNNFKSFLYKAKLLENIEADGINWILKNAKITVPLKCLRNFWRLLEKSLINCKVELKFKWTKYCVLSAPAADNVNNRDSDNIIFTIKDTKLYVSVVPLLARDNQELAELLSKGFERSVYWNEHKTKSGNKNTTNEFRYFIKSNFVGVNRLFVLVYTNHGDNAKEFNARKYYLPKGIIKNYNVIIKRKTYMINPLILIYDDMKK